MLPEDYILELRRRFLGMERELAKIFRACLIPLRKLPAINDPDEALYSYALSRKLLIDASRVYENRFLRTLSQEDFHIIYHAALQTIFAEANRRIALDVSSQESINFSSDINRAINRLLSKIVYLVYGITRRQESFSSISHINNALKAIILYEIAKSGLFAKCTSDIYSVIEDAMVQTFNTFDEGLEHLIFVGKRLELVGTWCFFDNLDIQLQEEYLRKKLAEDPLTEQDAFLPYWPETPEYSIANLQPLAIRQEFVQAFAEYWYNDQMFTQFDLDLEYNFELAFKQKFGLSIQTFYKVITEQAEGLPAQTRAQLCKSTEIGRLYLQLIVKNAAKKFVAINKDSFFTAYRHLIDINDLHSDRAIRLMLADQFDDLIITFQDRHRGSLGLSSYFVWPITLIEGTSLRPTRPRNISV